MSKYGKHKCAIFSDGVYFEALRTCDLKRVVRARRVIDHFYGPVRFGDYETIRLIWEFGVV